MGPLSESRESSRSRGACPLSKSQASSRSRGSCDLARAQVARHWIPGGAGRGSGRGSSGREVPVEDLVEDPMRGRDVTVEKSRGQEVPVKQS